jgi:hypothetical protein
MLLSGRRNRARTSLASRAGSRVTPKRRDLIVLVLLTAIGAYVVSKGAVAPAANVRFVPERHPQTTWAACNRNARNGKPSTFTPLSDAQAASLVTPEPETRPYNDRPYVLLGKRYPGANKYVPTLAQLQRYRDSRTSLGQPLLQFNPYLRYVDGRDSMRDPSTDDLIQWAAHKWGIPENWLRAEYVQESYWNQFQLGDETSVSPGWYALYPFQSRVPHSSDVYPSLGITQVKWIPNGAAGPGTEPLRWESTAFNIDDQAAMVRFYYDNPSGARSSWGDSSYAPCEAWQSIGGWYSPYPWGNAGQAHYVREVRGNLAERVWESPSFLGWSASSFPTGITFK